MHSHRIGAVEARQPRPSRTLGEVCGTPRGRRVWQQVEPHSLADSVRYSGVCANEDTGPLKSEGTWGYPGRRISRLFPGRSRVVSGVLVLTSANLSPLRSHGGTGWASRRWSSPSRWTTCRLTKVSVNPEEYCTRVAKV